MHFAAMLNGGSILDVVFLRSGGSEGVSFDYQRATATRRWLLISPEFRASEAELARVVEHIVSKAESTWKILPTWQEFSTKFEARAGPQIQAHKRRAMEVLALTTPALQAALNLKSVMSKADFKGFLSRACCTKRGMCEG